RVAELLKEFPGNYLESRYLGINYDKSLGEKIIIAYEMPLREMIKDFYGKLKGATQGYASLNYEMKNWRRGDLVKLEILIAGKREEAFSRIVASHQALFEGRALVRKLKELVPPQQFSVALQACLGGKVIARETISARGKDVIAPLYGGDYTRKRKLLERQKKGKRELKERGEIRIPQKVFLEMIKKA
ncbi:MAG: elongation factor 4, partial [bacterium]|nr:elongation factor 4 [bacterium]